MCLSHPTLRESYHLSPVLVEMCCGACSRARVSRGVALETHPTCGRHQEGHRGDGNKSMRVRLSHTPAKDGPTSSHAEAWMARVARKNGISVRETPIEIKDAPPRHSCNSRKLHSGANAAQVCLQIERNRDERWEFLDLKVKSVSARLPRGCDNGLWNEECLVKGDMTERRKRGSRSGV
ncbi:hypothetical protein C8R44DRAFT_754237 [Mycena epipterygia]|nr:hypothetical protein C8R44DRAFT_754237 [Mycena epipterygia]